jgi:hypothetical protein
MLSPCWLLDNVLRWNWLSVTWEGRRRLDLPKPTKKTSRPREKGQRGPAKSQTRGGRLVRKMWMWGGGA